MAEPKNDSGLFFGVSNTIAVRVITLLCSIFAAGGAGAALNHFSEAGNREVAAENQSQYVTLSQFDTEHKELEAHVNSLAGDMRELTANVKTLTDDVRIVNANLRQDERGSGK